MAVYRLSQLGRQVQENLELIENLQFAFCANKTYAVGDLVTYQGFLWRCHTDVSTAGAWTGELNWLEVSLKDLLDLKQNVISATSIPEGGVKEIIGFNDLNDLVHERVRVPYVEDETLIF